MSCCLFAYFVGSGLVAPNVKHDLPSFHRPSPVVGTSGGVVPPHASVHFGFEERPLGAFSGPGPTGSRGREFAALTPIVICPPPPPQFFDFSQRAPATGGQWCQAQQTSPRAYYGVLPPGEFSDV